MRLIVMLSINSYSDERVCGCNVPVRNMSCIHVELLDGQTNIFTWLHPLVVVFSTQQSPSVPPSPYPPITSRWSSVPLVIMVLEWANLGLGFSESGCGDSLVKFYNNEQMMSLIPPITKIDHNNERVEIIII